MKLSEAKGQSQNLHLMRFFAAVLVIISHSFILSTGSESGEWLNRLTGCQLTFGGFAVSVFFLCGGYLIAKSMERLKTFTAYFRARVLRILPPLIFVTALSALLGVFFSSYSPKEYFADGNTWKYLLNGILIRVHDLPGVFTDNVYEPSVNGSLWTLPVEFICYIACFILYKIGFMKKRRFCFSIPAAILGFGAIYILGSRITPLRAVVRPCLLFYIGMAFWVYREYIELKVSRMCIAVIGLILTAVFGVLNIGMYLFFPYIMFTLWFGIKQCPKKLGKLGNYSYGIYLWGFPVQQAVIQCMGGSMNPYLNMALSIPIAVILGIITYELTEKYLQKKLR